MGYQRPDIQSWSVHIKLLVAKPVGDPSVGMVDNFGSQHILVERCRPLPVADRDHAMVDPDIWRSHDQTLPHGLPCRSVLSVR